MKFKTNINCGNCVSKVKNTLDELVGSESWTVDTENPDKILSVINMDIQAAQIKKKLDRIGFSAELID